MLNILPGVVVGRFGEHQLLDGWHERQADGRSGIDFRAAAACGVLRLKNLPKARTLEMLISGPVGLMKGTMEGTIRIGQQNHRLALNVDHWVWRSYPLPSDREDSVTIQLEIPSPVVPDRVLGNGDGRRLGWYLSAIWLAE